MRMPLCTAAAFLLFLFVSTVVADPPLTVGAISQPSPLSEPVDAEALLGQYAPSAASDGEHHLVVWTDHRAGSYFGDIYGARVSDAGETLETYNFPIASTADAEMYPRVVWAGDEYLVAWTAYNPNRSWIEIARVTPDGRVTDTRELMPIASPYVAPRLAVNGSLLAFTNTGASSVTITSRDGLDARTATTLYAVDDIVPYGNGFLAFGRRGAGCANCTTQILFIWQISPEGDVTPPTRIGDSEAALLFGISNGHQVLIGTATSPVKLFLVDETFSARELPLALSAGSLGGVVWDGSSFVVGIDHKETSEVGIVRVSTNGTIENETRMARETAYPLSAASATSRTILFAGATFESYDYYTASAVRGVLFDSRTHLLDVTLSHSSTLQFNAAVVPDANGFFAVWAEAASDQKDVSTYYHVLPGHFFAAQLDRFGRAIQHPVAIGNERGVMNTPAVATTPEGNIIAWNDASLNAKLISDSRVLNEIKFGGPYYSGVGMLARENDVIIASSDGVETLGYRVHFDLTPIDSVPIPLGKGGQTPAFARTTNSYLLATATREFVCQVTCPAPPPPEMHVRRFDENGSILSEQLVARVAAQPALACSTNLCIVAWGSFYSSPGITYRLFPPDLASFSGEFSISIDGLRDSPSVVWNGREFLIAWSEKRSGDTRGYVLRVHSNGARGFAELLVTNRPVEFEHVYMPDPRPVLATHGDGTAVVIYCRHDEASGGVKRLFSIMIGRLRLRSVRR